jgi:hypothetical protein
MDATNGPYVYDADYDHAAVCSTILDMAYLFHWWRIKSPKLFLLEKFRSGDTTRSLDSHGYRKFYNNTRTSILVPTHILSRYLLTTTVL